MGLIVQEGGGVIYPGWRSSRIVTETGTLRMLRYSPRIARVSRIKFDVWFPDFWANPDPGHVPLDSDRRDIEFAGVAAFVASVAVRFVSEFVSL